MSEFRYFESGYFEPFFDALFELEDEPEEDDVLGMVTSGSRPLPFARLRLLRDRAEEEEREDEEALIALLTVALR